MRSGTVLRKFAVLGSAAIVLAGPVADATQVDDAPSASAPPLVRAELHGTEAPDGVAPGEAQAEEYATAHGVTLDEARRRLSLQHELTEELDLLSGLFEDRIAGAVISNEKSYRAIVTLTQGPDIPRLRELIQASGLPIDVEFADAVSRSARAAILQQHMSTWEKAFPDAEGCYFDERQLELVGIFPQGPPSDEEFAGAVGLFPARTEINEQEPFQDNHKGGLPLHGCTAAYSIYNPNVPGNRSLLTAAHCGRPQEYKLAATSGDWRWMSFKNELHNQNADIAWFDTQDTPRGRYYYNTAYEGAGSDVTGGSTNYVGSHVCHNGIATGFSCGDVDSVEYVPSYASACPGTCNPVFIYVNDAYIDCAGGDSGGPFWAPGSADPNASYMRGVHKGGNGQSAANPGHKCWYTRVDQLPASLRVLPAGDG